MHAHTYVYAYTHTYTHTRRNIEQLTDVHDVTSVVPVVYDPAEHCKMHVHICHVKLACVRYPEITKKP